MRISIKIANKLHERASRQHAGVLRKKKMNNTDLSLERSSMLMFFSTDLNRNLSYNNIICLGGAPKTYIPLYGILCCCWCCLVGIGPRSTLLQRTRHE